MTDEASATPSATPATAATSQPPAQRQLRHASTYAVAGLEPMLAEILQLVSAATKVKIRDMLSEVKFRHVSRARHMYCWLAQEHTRKSREQIGYYCGGRDQSTIRHSIQCVIDDRQRYEPELSALDARLKAFQKRQGGRS